MTVVIFGATGMVGKAVLLECLDDSRVERVLVVSRRPGDVSHPKLREIIHQDFFDLRACRSKPPTCSGLATSSRLEASDRKPGGTR